MSDTSKADDPGEMDLPGLSKTVRHFLRHHPAEAQIAVTAALEAAAVQFDAMPEPDLSVPDALKPFVVVTEKPYDAMINVAEAAKRLRVSRTTGYDWIESKRMMGWRAIKRSTVVPEEQIVGLEEIVSGPEEILAIIPDARAAWRFLSEESPFFAIPTRPIDALKAGDVDGVLAAVHAHGEAFS